ncbi:hypothetical protein L873DRAFT_1817932, partial [Choiromyces venosus 120613-1]
MPRKSYKHSVSADAQEFIGFSLLIDLFLNELEQEDLGSGSWEENHLGVRSMLDLSRTRNS